MRYFWLCCLSLIAFQQIGAQDLGFPNDLYTRAERTRFAETSLHTDVIRFVDALVAGSEHAHLEIMGQSAEGRNLPLVIMANPAIETPEEAIASGKAIIYVQGNIHGGEVEGKEALMILMREIAFGQKKWMLDNQILLFCPLFNPDGNEKVGPNNRSNQDGSPYLAGQRANGQGLDLNRDGLKLESFEGKALAENVMKRWDPDMFVDLHTTNGTWHGYEITYAPGLTTAGHPGSEEYMNTQLLPWLTNHLRERTGFETFFYGGFYEYPPKQYWGMYPEPRFLTNSFALKNKLALLVETFSHDHFEKRIMSNVNFVSGLLEYTHNHSSEIVSLLEDIDNQVIQEILELDNSSTKGLEFDYKNPPISTDLLAYELIGGKHSEKKIWFANVNAFLEMDAVRESRVPKAYVFPEEMDVLANKLKEHGVAISQLNQNENFQGEKFEVRQLNNESRSYQGHYPATLVGSFIETEQNMPSGSWYVDMAQPLAYLIFYLLEPQADDGLVYWNYFDEYLESKGIGSNRVDFPVFKVYTGSSGTPAQIDEDVELRFNSDHSSIVLGRLASNTGFTSVELISSAGQRVLHHQIPENVDVLQIDCGTLELGIYLIRLTGPEKSMSKKVFIRHLE